MSKYFKRKQGRAFRNFHGNGGIYEEILPQFFGKVESVPPQKGSDAVVIAKIHRVSAFLTIQLSITKKKWIVKKNFEKI